MTDSKYGLMREMDLNAPVSITLPAHVWRGFLAAYCSTKWESTDATSIMMEIQDALFDPLWAREQQAEAQRKHDEYHRRMSGILPGFLPPEIPPDAGNLTD